MTRLTRKKNNRKALVICNGDVLSKRAMAPLLKGRPFIVCADGGANKARRLGVHPDVIIGDLDSITSETSAFFSSVMTLQNADQESTDLEKALTYLVKHRFRQAVVVGATGGRPDHSLANLSILKKYHKKIEIVFTDQFCDTLIIRDKIIIKAAVGSVVSLMPLGRCEGIATVGLKYPLHREALELGIREGTSNEVVSSPVKISVKQGSLLLFVVKKK